jgi:hypothetical protein
MRKAERHMQCRPAYAEEPFAIGRFAVTQGEFMALVRDTDHGGLRRKSKLVLGLPQAATMGLRQSSSPASLLSG